jgi:hypothetical protein
MKSVFIKIYRPFGIQNGFVGALTAVKYESIVLFLFVLLSINVFALGFSEVGFVACVGGGDSENCCCSCLATETLGVASNIFWASTNASGPVRYREAGLEEMDPPECGLSHQPKHHNRPA